MAGGLGEVEAILFRPGLGALVRADEAGAVWRDAHSAEQGAAGTPRAVGRVVFLRQRPERRLAIRGENSLELPLLERLGGVFVRIAPFGASGRSSSTTLKGERSSSLRRRSASITSYGGATTSSSEGIGGEVVVERV